MCKVVYIESQPPYRLPLARACRPTEPGCLDISRYIWRYKDEAFEELRRLGYDRISPQESGMNEIVVLEEHEILCVRRGEDTLMHFHPDPYGQLRVVAFSKVRTP